MLAEERDRRGFSLGPLQPPPPFPLGTSRDWRLGVAFQLPLAATVSLRPQPGPLGARAAGRRAAGAPPPRLQGRARAPHAARARPRSVPPTQAQQLARQLAADASRRRS
ncbi:uncharacterized protein ACIGJ3_012485 [Trichechus inunguis]